MLLCMLPMTAFATADKARYVVKGEAGANNTYTLSISAPEPDMLGGCLALSYDTSKVALLGGDSFSAIQKASSISLANDQVEESELVNAAKGVVGFVWYLGGGASSLKDKPIATLQFSVQDGVTPNDFDAATFRLRYVPEKGFGSWETAAYLAKKAPYIPQYFYYLSAQGDALEIDFEYDGSDKTPENANEVVVRCVNHINEPVQAQMQINNTVYTASTDGVIRMPLVDDTYRYRASADGFGVQFGDLTVNGDVDQTIRLATDAQLVSAAKEELAIQYVKGDSAASVTDSLVLANQTDTGVKVSWKSSNTSVVTNGGLVYRPAKGKADATVTLTATLTHGSATAEKTFTVKVLAKPLDPSTGGSTGEEDKPNAGKFTDLGNVKWAQEAIEFLAEQGVIKGTSSTTFSPTANIKRGDFLLLLMRMIQPSDVKNGQEFADVPQGSYYHDAIVQARALGITNGIGDNRFGPERNISREEMITLTAQALQKTGYVAVTSERADLNLFADGSQVSGWAKDGMSAMVQQGFIVGSDNRLTPKSNTNRAEAAVFLYRIYQAHI